MSKIAIAGLQLEAQNGNNVDSMEAEIDAVKRRYPWVDMVVLGELNACGSDPACAQPMPGDTEARFAAVAKQNNIWLIPGTFLEASAGKVFNTCPVINPDGEVIARYRKQFPWLSYEATTSPGSDFVVFDVPGVGRFGISICYDLWFPETLRTLAWMGAEIILHPTLTSSIDREAEHCMIRANAATNQCFMFDVNVAGPLGVGQSMVAGPGGEVLYQADKGREIIALKLDMNVVREVRENGWHNLGQPLKSFRDSKVVFPQYTQGYDSEALQSLGPLQMPAPIREEDS